MQRQQMKTSEAIRKESMPNKLLQERLDFRLSCMTVLSMKSGLVRLKNDKDWGVCIVCLHSFDND